MWYYQCIRPLIVYFRRIEAISYQKFSVGFSRIMNIKQLHGYFWVGSLAAIIDFGILFLMVNIGMHYLMANTIAFISANIFNFLAGHYLVFNEKSKLKKLFHSYAAVLVISVVGLLINNGALFISVDLVTLHLYVGKVLATLIAFLWNFSARKRWVYI